MSVKQIHDGRRWRRGRVQATNAGRKLERSDSKTWRFTPLAAAVASAALFGPPPSAAVDANIDVNANTGPTAVRFATFNASLNRNASGALLSDLANPGGADFTTTVGKRIQQARHDAEIIQRIAPDVLLINEFDYDDGTNPGSSSTPNPLGYSSLAAQRFQDNFLSQSQGNLTRGMTAGIDYAYRYTPTTNTGIHSGFDLNNNGFTVSTPGAAGYGDDAFGFGNFPGQFGMTIYSKYEIVSVRTFQNFLWKDMPGNLLTNDPTANPLSGAGGFYSAAEVDVLRLSSKNHVDVTLNVNGQAVHFLTAHPTPPVFDGTEDRNGKRNHDEIRFWKDYINGESYVYDDQGGTGGLAQGSIFVIAGDYNADLSDGDSFKGLINGTQYNAIGQLLDDPLVNTSLTPSSDGAAEQAGLQGGANNSHLSPAQFDTADFADTAPGNLRVDYVLPSSNTLLLAAGVFWPEDPNDADNNSSGDLIDLVGQFGRQNLFAGFPSSDHKAVWIDAQISAVPIPAALPLLGSALLGLATIRRRFDDRSVRGPGRNEK